MTLDAAARRTAEELLRQPRVAAPPLHTEAEKLLQQYGRNTLVERNKPKWKLFLEQACCSER